MFSTSQILKKSSTDFCLCIIKHISRNPRIRIVPEFDLEFTKAYEQKTMSSKKHPGKVPRILAEFDENMLNTVKNVMKDDILKNIVAAAKTYCNYTHARQPPITKSNYREKKRETLNEVMGKLKVNPLTLPEEKYARAEKAFSNTVTSLLKQRVYNWIPINYTSYVGKQYLVSRMVAELAALKRIFSEIALRNPDFQPVSLFDFGSGVGTVTCAVRDQWPNALKECFNVDSSAEMNEIAELVLKGGDENATLPIPTVYYRQFLNVDSQRKYNLVVSSYTLMELPSMETRLQTLSNLWNKTNDFLVLVEHGTSAGFQLIHEAREYLLHSESSNENSPGIHIFSPCSHELLCPQKQLCDRPCCFKASYLLPPIGRRSTIHRELYSFVVFRKGKKPENEKQWPRVLKDARKRKHRARCRLCCPDGTLRIVTFTKGKHGRSIVEVLRNCKSGDRLPATLKEVDLDDVKHDDAVEILPYEEAGEESSDEESDNEIDAETT